MNALAKSPAGEKSIRRGGGHDELWGLPLTPANLAALDGSNVVVTDGRPVVAPAGRLVSRLYGWQFSSDDGQVKFGASPRMMEWLYGVVRELLGYPDYQMESRGSRDDSSSAESSSDDSGAENMDVSNFRDLNDKRALSGTP